MGYAATSYFLGLFTWYLSSKGFGASLVLLLIPLLLIGMKIDSNRGE